MFVYLESSINITVECSNVELIFMKPQYYKSFSGYIVFMEYCWLNGTDFDATIHDKLNVLMHHRTFTKGILLAYTYQ